MGYCDFGDGSGRIIEEEREALSTYLMKADKNAIAALGGILTTTRLKYDVRGCVGKAAESWLEKMIDKRRVDYFDAHKDIALLYLANKGDYRQNFGKEYVSRLTSSLAGASMTKTQASSYLEGHELYFAFESGAAGEFAENLQYFVNGECSRDVVNKVASVISDAIFFLKSRKVIA